MYKRIRNAVITLSLGISLLAFNPFVFADESISIVTYYPSPYGVYNELTTTSNTYLATTEGNVGIGTTSPGAKLQIVSAASASDIIGLTVTQQDADNWAASINGNGYGLDIGNSTWNLRVGTGKSTFAGNVGIGTVNPVWGLEVNSSANHQYVLVSTQTASRDTGIQFRDSSGVIWYPRHGSDGKFHICYYNPGTSINTPYLSIDRTGNVGIGTTTPAGTLDVNGALFSSKYVMPHV